MFLKYLPKQQVSQFTKKQKQKKTAIHLSAVWPRGSRSIISRLSEEKVFKHILTFEKIYKESILWKSWLFFFLVQAMPLKMTIFLAGVFKFYEIHFNFQSSGTK